MLPKRIMSILESETGGTSYKAHKYSLDHVERPFIDYTEDSFRWQRIGEKKPPKKYMDLTHASKDVLQAEPILTYFLDGSRRVYKVDDIAYKLSGKRSVLYPVIAGQIGVGCTRRVNKIIEKQAFKQEFVISLPSIADPDGKAGFFPSVARKLDKCQALRNLNISFANILPYSISSSSNQKENDEDYISKGTACVQDRMVEKEKEMVADLVRENRLDPCHYLIKDGSLEYKPTKEDLADKHRLQMFRQNYNYVLGISKGFNPMVCNDISGNPNPGFIADLPLFHRTPVARFVNPDRLGDTAFAVWYIRIRDQKYTRTPFDGVVKVEKILVTRDEESNGMDSELVDLLSAHVINERTPVCYGADLRWANHLYPIYLTESFVKSKYLSDESFLNLF